MTLKMLIAKKRRLDFLVIFLQIFSICLILLSSLIASGKFSVFDSFDRYGMALMGMNISTVICIASIWYYVKVIRPFSVKLKRVYFRAYNHSHKRNFDSSFAQEQYNKTGYRKAKS